MKSKNHSLLKAIASAICTAVLLGSVGSPAYASDSFTPSRQKIVGDTRYETAVLISREIDNYYSQNQYNNTCKNVVLVNGTAISDALCATPFAYRNNARILLTDKDGIPESTLAEIEGIHAENIYLIGGTDVIGIGVEKQLDGKCRSITRIGGTDRYETSVMVAKTFGTAKAISIVNGLDGMADATSIAAPAAALDMPILMTSEYDNGNSLNRYLNVNGRVDKAYVIGGTTVLPDSVITAVNSYADAVERLGGEDRNKTNTKVISKFYPDETINKIYVVKDGCYVEDELVDALSVGVLAAKTNSPVMIAASHIDSSQKEYAENKYLKCIVQVGGNGNETACEELAYAGSVDSFSYKTDASQVMEVYAPKGSTTGTFIMYNKIPHGWRKVMKTSCYLGQDGIADKTREGERKTPAGEYKIGRAFGIADNPGCTRTYTKVDSTYYWIDDSNSSYYNRLVTTRETGGIKWNSAEHIVDSPTAYKYVLDTGYNSSCTPGVGSAIFIHCSNNRPTWGCIAVSESSMVYILQNVSDDAIIYIHQS